MSHTELHFMIENYVLFVSLGLLAVTALFLLLLALLEKWRGEKK